MANEYVNELEINGQKRLDLTQDTATPETVLEGETFHLRSGAPATGTYRPSDEIEARLRATVGHSSKNLLDMTKYTTMNGISNIQINKDTGSLSCTGTGVWCAVNYLTNDDLSSKPNGTTYILTCINNLASSSTAQLAIRRRDTNVVGYSASLSTTGKKELKFTANSEKFPNGWYVSILVTGGTSGTGSADISNLMLREASIADDTFEPYQELTETLIETKVKAYLNSTVGHSSKNLLEITEEYKLSNGVTFTVNKTAGTITASGTATSDAQLDFQGSSPKSVNSGIIKNGLIYSCEGTNSNLVCAISYYNSSGTYISEQRATTSGTIISIPSNANSYRFWVRKRPAAGSAAFVFKPMLRKASISDGTFEPYVTPTDDRIVDLEARVAALEAIINNR